MDSPRPSTALPIRARSAARLSCVIAARVKASCTSAGHASDSSQGASSCMWKPTKEKGEQTLESFAPAARSATYSSAQLNASQTCLCYSSKSTQPIYRELRGRRWRSLRAPSARRALLRPPRSTNHLEAAQPALRESRRGTHLALHCNKAADQ
eukprot:6084046-Pleurochrysis_carterae.AAC.1